MITHKTIIKEANNFLQKNFNTTLDIPIEYNGRISKSLGRFIFQSTYRERKALRIELAKKLIEYYDDDTIIDVLRHELVHYALFKAGLPHNDGHPVFERKLRELGVNPTNIIKPQQPLHTVICEGCGKIVYSGTRNTYKNKNLSRYKSVCCRASIKYIGVEFRSNYS
jgi:SprT-like protein